MHENVVCHRYDSGYSLHMLMFQLNEHDIILSFIGATIAIRLPAVQFRVHFRRTCIYNVRVVSGRVLRDE